MFKKIIENFYLPRNFTNLMSAIGRRNATLQASLFFLNQLILIGFITVNILNKQQYSQYIDAIFLLFMIIQSIYFRYVGNFTRSFFIYLLTLIFLVAIQHAVAPVHLSTNMLWLPILLYTGAYLLNKKLSALLAFAGTVLFTLAFILPHHFETPTEQTPIIAATIINIFTLIIGTLTIYIVAGIFAREEQRIRDDLNKSYEMLQELNETNAALISVVSHDLCTPLTTAKGFLMFKNLDKVDEALNRINDILSDVKKYRSVGCGKLKLDLRPVSLSEVIRISLEDVSTRAASKNISINIKKDDPDARYNIMADGSSLRTSVLTNLLTNAIKFSQRNSKIDLTLYDIDNNSTCLIIQDYGIGMPEHIKNSIFDFSAPTSRVGTEQEHGTGFGLPITKLFMDKYSGKIDVQSESEPETQNCGTTFKLTFKKVNTDPS